MQESMWRSLGRHLQACHKAELEDCTHAADNGVVLGSRDLCGYVPLGSGRSTSHSIAR